MGGFFSTPINEPNQKVIPIETDEYKIIESSNQPLNQTIGIIQSSRIHIPPNKPGNKIHISKSQPGYRIYSLKNQPGNTIVKPKTDGSRKIKKISRKRKSK